MEWYERIKQLREANGMTQDDLAQLMGYSSRSSINKIELGKTDIPVSKLIVLAKLLNTTPAAIIEPDSVVDGVVLSKEERDLIQLFRSVPIFAKETIRAEIQSVVDVSK